MDTMTPERAIEILSGLPLPMNDSLREYQVAFNFLAECVEKQAAVIRQHGRDRLAIKYRLTTILQTLPPDLPGGVYRAERERDLRTAAAQVKALYDDIDRGAIAAES